MRSAVILSILLTACASPGPASGVASVPKYQHCETAAEDRRWLSDALIAWQTALRDFLRASDKHLPTIVTYDGSCSYTLVAAPDSIPRW